MEVIPIADNAVNSEIVRVQNLHYGWNLAVDLKGKRGDYCSQRTFLGSVKRVFFFWLQRKEKASDINY